MSDDYDYVPTCRCGEPMDVNEGYLADVVRCATGECRSEGVRGPEYKLYHWLRRRLS